MIDFTRMCDKCYYMLEEKEDIFIFKLIDDNKRTIVIKGHEDCMEQVGKTLKELYGKSE